MLNRTQKVHLIGANGVGLSAVGKLFLRMGKKVSGSDLFGGVFSEELEKLGATISLKHTAENLSEDTDIVIYSSAVPEENPERIAAEERGIKQMSFAQFLGALSEEHKVIAVSGTHGKSTTTAMLGLILEEAGMDPLVIVGSRVPSWEDPTSPSLRGAGSNLRVGTGEYFVFEACEHQANHLLLKPTHAVITNIEEDHMDYYRDLDHIRKTFEQFGKQTKGSVFLNADDHQSSKLELENVILFGYGDHGLYHARDRKLQSGKQTFGLYNGDELLGEIELQVPGEYNMMNAVAAASVSLELGVEMKAIQKSLSNFTGIWRRFERLGEWKGAEVISDYGHHPTAVEKSLVALREFFPERRVVHIFEPHQHARTKDMFTEFISTLGQADVTIISEIYEVAGRTEDDTMTSQTLVDAIKEVRPDAEVYFGEDLDHTETLVRKHVKDGDILFFQGAGTIDEVPRRLV